MGFLLQLALVMALLITRSEEERMKMKRESQDLGKDPVSARAFQGAAEL